MLVIGPVHAQIVLACAAMDMVMHDDCSCDGFTKDRDCVDSGFDTAVHSSSDPCCELSAEICIDEGDGQAAPSAKPPEMRSDVDRPQTIIASFDFVEPLQSVAGLGVIRSVPTPGRFGSDIYLITQRLRI